MKQQKYFPPKFKERQFHCVYCGVYAAQYWENIVIATPAHGSSTEFMASFCTHCQESAYWYQGRMIVPSEAPVEPPHEDLPDDCKEEYNEAREIFARSPRGAAALLRLCVQKLMPHLGGSGDNINDDIATLVVKGLPMEVQQALDVCRVVGNHAVHPGDIQVNDTPEVAQSHFRMVNFVVEDRITRPRETRKLFDTLPDKAKQAISKRDASAGSQSENE